jgi:signal transduction histidine kinase
MKARREAAPGAEALRRSRLLRVALALLTALLAAFAFGGFTVVIRFARAQERAIDTYLRASGEGLARALPANDYLWALPLVVDPATGALDPERLDIYADYPIWDNWRATLSGMAEGGRLNSAWLLTPAGDPLVKSDGSEATDADRRAILPRDEPLVRLAAAGTTASDQPSRRERRKRVYVPLRMAGADGQPRVVALLRLELNRDYFGAVREQLERNVLLLALTGVVLAAVWWLFLRFVRRSIESEKSAAQADRLRALGTMTAGIAHELRNPLGIMRLELEELRATAEAEPDGPLRRAALESAGALRREVERLEALTDQFLDMARPAAAGAAPVDAAEEVRAVLKVWRKGLPAGRRTVREDIAAEPLHVAMGADRLRQVLLNLLRNADEALGPRSGTISVVLQRDGEEVVLAVEDDGPGMDAATAAQCFDPFFTTRAEGTGLGLPLCRSIAESVGGRVAVRTEPGRGARFEVRQPGVAPPQ